MPHGRRWNKKKSLEQKVYNVDTPYQTRSDAFWFFASRRDADIGLFNGGAKRGGAPRAPARPKRPGQRGHMQ